LERDRLKTALEIATNIALLLVAIAALTSFGVNYFVKSSSSTLSPGLQKGAILEPIPRVDYQNSKQTLVIALNTNCGYCRDSLPFFRELIEASNQSNNTHLVAIFPNNPDEVKKYVNDNHLSLDSIADADFRSLGIRGTPSLILIDSKGIVNDFWIGKLQRSEEDQLIHSLNSGGETK